MLDLTKGSDFELIPQNYVKLPRTYDIIVNLLTFYAQIYYHVKPQYMEKVSGFTIV
ncbi:hypothetical protein MSIBF_A3560001 [groundwater metagenome]|uniref:Uncharacterized protein n=1 Tax=groundwater metagenome TaxID=717931 RepID=A0A098EB80_9ZZZZ